MMAKVSVNFDEKAFAASVRQTFQKVKQSRQLQAEIGQFLVDRIKGEARRGRPLNALRAFPPLADSSIRNRRNLARYNQTGRPFRPDFSNTTLTGQLLDALSFTPSRDFVVVEIEDSKRAPYTTGANGQKQKLKSGVSETNKELALTLAEKGFIVFDDEGIRKEEKIIRRIRSITLKFLRRALRVARL